MLHITVPLEAAQKANEVKTDKSQKDVDKATFVGHLNETLDIYTYIYSILYSLLLLPHHFLFLYAISYNQVVGFKTHHHNVLSNQRHARIAFTWISFYRQATTITMSPSFHDIFQLVFSSLLPSSPLLSLSIFLHLLTFHIIALWCQCQAVYNNIYNINYT